LYKIQMNVIRQPPFHADTSHYSKVIVT